MTDIPGPGWRGDVRDRIAAALALGVPGVSVFRARVWPVEDAARPALLVYGYAEEKVGLPAYSTSQHQFTVTASMVVTIRGAGAAGEAQEAALEGLARQVERAVLTAPTLWGVAGVLTHCERVVTRIEVKQRGDLVESEATIEFRLQWDEVFTVADPPGFDPRFCDEPTVVFDDPTHPVLITPPAP